MGFLNFWNSRPLVPEDDEQPGSLSELPDEPTRKLANRHLHNEVKARGGDPATHGLINAVATREMLGHSPTELYRGLGLSRADRSQLPYPAKEALQVGDIAARERILYDDAQGHQELVDSATEGYKKVKGIFPWNRQHRVKPKE